MQEIELTGTLKTYKAIVLYPGHSMPEGYFPGAGAYTQEGQVRIAFPNDMQSKPKLLNRLIDQAENVLMRAFPTDQITWGGNP